MRKKHQQQQTNFYDFAPFYPQIQEAYKTYMRTIGILLGGDPSSVKDRMDEIYDLEKTLAKVGFNLVWKYGVVVLVPRPAIPLRFNENPVSRTSVIAFPNIVFFSSLASVSKFWRIPLFG